MLLNLTFSNCHQLMKSENSSKSNIIIKRIHELLKVTLFTNSELIRVFLITTRKRSFTIDCLSTGGSVFPQCHWAGRSPSVGRPPPSVRRSPLSTQTVPQDTVNRQPVYILLECILVLYGIYYCPRSVASEGYVFTGVCHFNGGGDTKCIMG